MPATFTPIDQSPQYSDGVLHEYDAFHYCRETATLLSGQNLTSLTVLGKITASGKWTQLAPAATDGSEVAAGMLVLDTDASAGDKETTVLVRGPAILREEGLVWPAGITEPQLAAAKEQLNSIGIPVVTGIPV